MLKVKDNDKLARDENSRAIINTDSGGLRQARLAKNKILERMEREKALEERVKSLEETIIAIQKRLEQND